MKLTLTLKNPNLERFISTHGTLTGPISKAEKSIHRTKVGEAGVGLTQNLTQPGDKTHELPHHNDPKYPRMPIARFQRDDKTGPVERHPDGSAKSFRYTKLARGHTAESYGMKHFGHLKDLPQYGPERMAISHYKHSGDRIMNGLARGTHPETFTRDMHSGNWPYEVEAKRHAEQARRSHSHMQHLDHVTNTNQLPHNVTLYRGVTGRNARLMHQLHHEGTLQGHHLHETGYTSTTLDAQMARNWASQDKGVTMHIKAPKGTKGAYLDHLEASHYGAEHEMLLPRGRTFHLTGSHLEHTPDGKQHLHVFAEIKNHDQPAEPLKLHPKYQPLLGQNYHEPHQHHALKPGESFPHEPAENTPATHAH